jgi:two-component system LytT family response regulator
MNKLKVVIIDDEYAAAENIHLIISNYCEDLNVMGMAHSISEGIKLVRKVNPDLVFLDISMPPEGTGFDFLDLVPDRTFDVIFVTAHEEFSLQAIKKHAFDYILKPVDYRDLIKSVTQFTNKFYANKPANAQPNGDATRVKLPTEEGYHLIEKKNVIYCKASGSYTEFIIEDSSPILISKPLKYAERLLGGSPFVRIHRSYLVNTDRITKLIKQDGGYVEINGEQLPVSKNHHHEVFSLF